MSGGSSREEERRLVTAYVAKSEFLAFRDKIAGIVDRVRVLARENASSEMVAEALLAEFNWGGGLATGNIPRMLEELK